MGEEKKVKKRGERGEFTIWFACVWWVALVALRWVGLRPYHGINKRKRYHISSLSRARQGLLI